MKMSLIQFTIWRPFRWAFKILSFLYWLDNNLMAFLMKPTDVARSLLIFLCRSFDCCLLLEIWLHYWNCTVCVWADLCTCSQDQMGRENPQCKAIRRHTAFIKGKKQDSLSLNTKLLKTHTGNYSDIYHVKKGKCSAEPKLINFVG